MKQCPSCNRTYSDDKQIYCFEDGTQLRPQYDPQATIRISEQLPTDALRQPPAAFTQHSNQQPTHRRHWPIYLAIVLLLVAIGGGGIALLVFQYGRTGTASANASQRVVASGPTLPASVPSPELSPSVASAPSPSPSPSAKTLVGSWRTNVFENNQNMQIIVTFRPNGTTGYVFKSTNGQATDSGTWQYSDQTLFERFSNGASGKGSIRWIDQDHFEITIIDNGVPSYAGVKRRYTRLR